MSVIPFRRPQREEPYIGGDAKCIGCGHQWEAAAPVGTWQLECPSCGTMKGIFRNPVGAVEGDSVLRCSCGCEALTAYQRHGRVWLRCMSCGLDQTETFFG